MKRNQLLPHSPLLLFCLTYFFPLKCHCESLYHHDFFSVKRKSLLVESSESDSYLKTTVYKINQKEMTFSSAVFRQMWLHCLRNSIGKKYLATIKFPSRSVRFSPTISEDRVWESGGKKKNHSFLTTGRISFILRLENWCHIQARSDWTRSDQVATRLKGYQVNRLHCWYLPEAFVKSQ